MLCTPKSRILAQSHAYLTVGQANLTVKMGCSHCEQCWEVERSALILSLPSPKGHSLMDTFNSCSIIAIKLLVKL